MWRSAAFSVSDRLVRPGDCFYLRLRCVLTDQNDPTLRGPVVGGHSIDKEGRQVGDVVYFVPVREAVPVRIVEREVADGSVVPVGKEAQ